MPGAPLLLESLESWRTRRADRIAIREGEREVTYRELADLADRAAGHLRWAGCGGGSVVAMSLPRSSEAVATMLGVVSLGAAFVNLDPAHPPAWRRDLLDRLHPDHLVVEEGSEALAGDVPTSQVGDVLRHRRRRPAATPTAGNLAYLIFTSGSTGTPKAVQISHRSLDNHLTDLVRLTRMTSSDVALAFSSPSFDSSLEEIFVPLTVGATVVLRDADWDLAPSAFTARCVAERLAVVTTPTAYWRELVAADACGALASGPLRLFVIGGELAAAQQEREFLAQTGRAVELANSYGPTECAITVAWHVCDGRSPTSRVPIGEPLAGVSLSVRDPAGLPVGPGIVGELYIGGVQVGEGYRADPALTAERFVPGPCGGRWYRTGDRARRLFNGRYEILGRMDDQVKINGYRVEPEEVATLLRAHPGVADAAVVVAQTGDVPRLVAFVDTGADTWPDVRRYASHRLPPYLRPAQVIAVGGFPRTVNGKIDRRALLDLVPPTEAGAAGSDPDRPLDPPPRSSAEAAVLEILADVLGVPSLSRTADFFALGGHSLLAVRAAARIRAVLDVDLTIRDIFEAPDVGGVVDAAVARTGRGAGAARQERPDRLPLSAAQRRLWIQEQVAGPSSMYHIPLAFTLDGELDAGRLVASVRDVIAEHEVLRTVYRDTGGDVEQVVLPEDHPAVRGAVADVTAAPAAVEAAAAAVVTTPFDLSGECPVRFRLMRVGATRHVLAGVVHHIAFDGWSSGIFLREVGRHYRHRAVERTRRVRPETAWQYADHVSWEASEAARAGSDVSYWRRQLADLAEETRLPTDHPRTSVNPPVGYAACEVDAEVHSALAALARESRATVFMVVHAALTAALSRLGAGPDIAIGTVHAGRPELAHADLIGFFVNTLVLRVSTAGDPDFRELLKRVRRTDLDGYSHDRLPFDKLVELVRPRRVAARNPLFQVSLNWRETGGASLDLPGVSAEPLYLPGEYAKFDLAFTVDEARPEAGPYQGLSCRLAYNAEIFEAATATAIVDLFRRVLVAVSRDHGTPLPRLRLLDPRAGAAMVELGRGRRRPVPARTLAGLFLDRVAAHPDRPAVRFRDAQLTFAELDRRVSHLASRLWYEGVRPGAVVAVVDRRSLELVTTLLAIHRAGAAYLPLDPDHPPARLRSMVEDSAPVLAVAPPQYSAVLPDRLTVVDPSGAGATDRGWRRRPDSPDLPAYVIFTSGSTGRPKGVQITQRAIVNRLLWMRDHLGVTDADVVLHKTPYTFDVSVWEIFLPLITGCRLVIAEPGGHEDPDYLARAIVADGVTMVHFVPSVLSMFLESPRAAGCRGLRRVICSGEALAPDLRDRFHRTQPAELHNLYGPTEAAVDVTCARCLPDDDGSVAIGRPVDNTDVSVLDPAGRPVPTLVPGELHLSGVQLATGYVGQPGVTAGRFLPDPYGPPGGRMYRTGDLVRWNGRGELEYLSRVDDQVQVNGLRIELREIEIALRAHPAVRAAAVAAQPLGRDGTRLVANVVPDPEVVPVVAALATASGLHETLYRRTMAPGVRVCGPNPTELEFLGREIFHDRDYLAGGISLPPDATVVDVGAHIGMFAVFVGAARPRARVVAVEPVPELCALLRYNTLANGCRVAVHQVGLAAEPGRAEFTYYPGLSLLSGRYADAAADRAMVEAVAGRAGGADGGESAELGRLIDERMASRTVTVEMSTLSEVIDAEGLERIDLVKIDVERSEYDGLAGLREEHWHRIAQFAIEVHDEEGGNLARVVAMLERHGFRTRVRVGRSQEGTGLVMVTASHPERVREDGSGAPGTPDAAGRSGDAGRPDGGADEAEPLVAQLRSHLAERLPTYMIPGQMSVVAALPVTANGKLDRNALVLPRNREPGAAVALDPFQVAVADLMSGVLAGGPLGPGDDFFAAGGHSLLAIRVANEVRATFGVDLAVRDIFDNPTPARLADVIRRAANAARPPLVPVDRCGDLPLSFGQQRTWLLDRMSGEGHVYHIPLALRLRGPLDVSALEAAVNDLVARHEILRTCYPDQNGTPVQRVVPVEQARLTMYRVAADEDAVDALLSGFATEPIDLGVDLPVRTQLLVLGEHAHILALCFHHIAFDGWSLDPLWNDLSGLYRARVRGGRPDLPDLPVQYADFAAWQLRLLGSEEDPESLAARQMAYWRRALANAPEALSLPLDRPRPYEPTFQAGSYRFDIDPATQRQLRQVARDAGGSLFMVLHAALATFLTRAGAGTDIAIGTPTAGRADRAFEAMIGFFANTLTLRVDSSGDPTFRDVVSRARRAALDALANSDLPFERVVELANPHRSVSLHPLFQIMMTLTPYPPRTPSFEDLDCEPVPISNGSTKFDLQLAFHENEASQQMDCLIEYSRDIFEPATIERLAKRLAAVLTGASANPDLPLSRLELVDDAEWARLAGLGEGDALPVTDTSPGQRLRELAAADPAAPMLVGTGGEQLSRAELVDRAAGWAGVLRAAGVVEGRAVGLAMARSVDRVVATVALAWCGAVAVPVDPAWPAERRDLIAADVDMRLVVTDGQAVTASLPEIVVSGAPPGDAVRIRPVPGGQRPLYIMYTSGSTGRPKGVQVTHQNVMNLVRNAFLSTPARRQLSLASHAFDASTLEVWGTLLNGGTLVVPPPGQLGPEEIRTYLHEHAVSHLFLTTALLSLMADEAPDLFAGLVEIATGGEALPAGTVRAVLTAAPATVLRNCYGPTEVTVMATHHEVGQRDLEQERVAIGHPVDGAVVYVLDEHLRPVPEGVTGHLWVGGHGVSSGYVNNPAATAERFLPDLFRGDGSRMYRTGDLASWRTDGKLEFRGREDDQIKLRGHRIEPGEVSAVLEMHPAVRHAFTALRREGERGGLFSWVVLAEGGQERDVPPLLSAHLSRHLPGYMLPGAVTVVERLPVTATGKIDKAALPAPAVVSSGRQPTTVEEQAVCRAFAEVVGTDRIGLDSDFFAVGGDSLLAVRLASRLQQVLGTHPGVRAIFHHPTPAGLLAAVRGEDQEEAWAREDDAWRPLLRLRPGGHLPPLFCVHPAIGLAWCYRSLLPHLDDGIPVVGLQSPGVTGAAPSRLEEAAARFVDIVEGHQPAGPVCLLGWSVGGVIAHEVAVQLQRRGRQVSLLALVDAYPDLGAGSREPQVRLSERALSRALSLTAGARSVMDSKRHERVLSAVQANVGMCHGFRPGRFEGDLLFFIAKLGRTDRSPDPMSWRELVTGDVTYCDLPATHDDALRPVPARIIGRSLSESSVYTREPVVDRAAPAPTCRGHGSDGGRVEGPEPSTGSSGN